MIVFKPPLSGVFYGPKKWKPLIFRINWKIILYRVSCVLYLSKRKTMTQTKKQPAPQKPVISIDELAYKAWIEEKKAQYKRWVLQCDRGELKDDVNPAFLFSGVPTELLVKIISGEISAQFLASMELSNRGADKSGKWVGFDQAEKIHFPTI